MNPLVVFSKKVVHQVDVEVSPDAVQIPHRMIKDDEHFRFGVESSQNLFQVSFAWMMSKGGEDLHPFGTPRAGEIMHSDMKGFSPKRNRPFDGDRAVSST